MPAWTIEKWVSQTPKSNDDWLYRYLCNLMCCRLIGSTWLCQSGLVEAHRRWRTVAPITREPSDGNYVPEIRYFKLLLRHGTCMNGDCCSMAPRLVPLSRSNRVALGGSLGLVQGMLFLCSKNLLNLALLKHMKRFRGPSIV